MAQVVFNPLTGVEIPPASEVIKDVGESFQKAFEKKGDEPINIDPTSPLGQLVDSCSAEIIAKNAEIAYIANQNNLKVAEGRSIDNLASLILLSRKLSEATIVSCVCRGLKGTVIPYGAIVEDSLGNQFRHNAVGGVTIPDTGVITTTFSSIVHGPIEVSVGTVTKIVTVIPGWDSIDNDAVGVIGRDRETDSEFRARYERSVSINSVGTTEAIEANIANVDGVIDVRVLENLTNQDKTEFGVRVPGHGVAVCVFGGEDSDIAKSIFKTKMAGTAMAGNTTVTYFSEKHFNAKYEYPIYRPEAQNLYVKVDFYATSMSESIQESVKNAIVQDALGMLNETGNPRIGLAQTIYADRFRNAINTVTTVPVRQIQLALNNPSEWKDRLVVNADVEPAVIDDNVTIIFSEP